MTKKLCLGLAVLLLMTSGLLANGLNLNGVGTKSVTMGGAFIGLANDYSAIFWNPAGLTQIKKPQFFLFETNLMPDCSYVGNGGYTGISSTTKSKTYFSGAIGYLHPINDRLIVGLGVYIPAGVGSSWNEEGLALMTGGTEYTWRSFFCIATFSPTIAYKITDTFSLGATFNVNYGYLKMERYVVGQYTEKLHGWTVGATFGAFYKPSDRFSAGLMFRTPSKVTFKGTAEMPGAAGYGLPTEVDAEREATWPMFMGAGIAFKPVEKLTLTADAQYTNWKKMQEIPITFSNDYWNAYFGSANAFVWNWKNAVQWRFGAEYAVNQTWAIRGGYYYDPTVAPTNTLNILLPEATYNAVTFGIGIHTGKVQLDFGVEYLMGKDATKTEGQMTGVYGVDILVPNVSFTYHF